MMIIQGMTFASSPDFLCKIFKNKNPIKQEKDAVKHLFLHGVELRRGIAGVTEAI